MSWNLRYAEEKSFPLETKVESTFCDGPDYQMFHKLKKPVGDIHYIATVVTHDMQPLSSLLDENKKPLGHDWSEHGFELHPKYKKYKDIQKSINEQMKKVVLPDSNDFSNINNHAVVLSNAKEVLRKV